MFCYHGSVDWGRGNRLELECPPEGWGESPGESNEDLNQLWQGAVKMKGPDEKKNDMEIKTKGSCDTSF